MKQTLIYSLKVWLTSVVIAPVLILTQAFFRGTDPGYIMLPFEWFLGALFSAPSFILLYISCKCVLKSQIGIILTKGLLSAVGVLLSYLPSGLSMTIVSF